MLAAAIRVVADSGLRNLTYRAVAREAGVTHGLVTHHFGSREALIAEALQYSLDSSVPGITKDPGAGRIDILFDGLAALVTATPDLQAFQYELSLESRRSPALRPDVQELYRSYRDALRAELHDAGLDGDALVHLVFAALDGLVFQQVCEINEVSTDAALAELRRILVLLQEQAGAGTELK